MYHNLSNGRNVTISTIRRAHPTVSLRRNPPDDTLAALGYARIHPTPRPEGDVVTQGQPEQRDGAWYQTWDVREFTEEERAEQLKRERTQALDKLNVDYDAAMRPLIRTYPEVERESWDQQKAEATAYKAWLDAGSQGDAPTTPVLDRILAGRNGTDGTETIAELVGKVLRNAEAFVASQELTGRRHRGERLILAAETPEEARTVTWASLAEP